MSPEQKQSLLAALDKLQDAQNAITEAGEALSTVEGFGTEWSKCIGLYDDVKSHWHKINTRACKVLQEPETPSPGAK